MKKRESTEEYRLRNRRLSVLREREAKRRKIVVALRRKLRQVDLLRHSEVQRNKNPQRIEVKAPKQFDVLSNTAEMMEFFDRVVNFKSGENIYLNFADVKKVSFDSILYLCCVIDECRDRGIILSGNYPYDDECRRAMRRSAFETYLTRRIKKEIQTDSHITIWGTKSEPERSRKIIDFIASKLPGNSHLKTFQSVLVECMTNSHNHAYAERGERKWWLTANYSAEERCVSISFLDNGAGIAATIRKNFWEKIQRAFAGASDVKLIHSALMGDFRTKTRQKERGLGLPAIFRYYRNGHLQNFHLISTSAALHAGDNGQLIQQPLPVAFKGTLFAWRTGEVTDEKGN